MIKTLIAGLWVWAITLASVYFGSKWDASHGSKVEDKSAALELVRMKPITVPVINSAGVEGYLVAMIGYNIDKSKMPGTTEAIVPILQDESFRTLYGVEAAKYKKPRKSDLLEVSKTLVDVMNRRLASEAIKDVLIEEFSFIPKEKARSGRW